MPYRKTIQEIETACQSDLHKGLSEEEAQRRQKEQGKNILNICNVIAVLFSLTTLICLNGIHRKTFSSVLSTLCVLFLIMALFEFSIYMY